MLIMCETNIRIHLFLQLTVATMSGGFPFGGTPGKTTQASSGKKKVWYCLSELAIVCDPVDEEDPICSFVGWRNLYI